MTIHYSAAFTGRQWRYHGTISVAKLGSVDSLMSMAIRSLKQKCEHYNVQFDTMNRFELYHFVEGEEVMLYEKSKN